MGQVAGAIIDGRKGNAFFGICKEKAEKMCEEILVGGILGFFGEIVYFRPAVCAVRGSAGKGARDGGVAKGRGAGRAAGLVNCILTG